MIITRIQITLPTTPSTTTITIDSNSLLSCKFPHPSRSNYEKPSWGIVANNGGSVEFVDKQNVFLDYINAGVLYQTCPAIAKLINTNNGKEETIWDGNTTKWDYNPVSKKVSVELSDKLDVWQSLEFGGYQLTTSKTAYQLYQYLYSITPNNSNIVLDSSAQTQLQNIVVPYPYIEAGTLWSAWRKLCELAQLYIYSFGGQIYVRYAIGG